MGEMPTDEDKSPPLPSSLLLGEFGLLVEQLRSTSGVGAAEPVIADLARVLATTIAERDSNTLRVVLDLLSQHDLGGEDSPSPELAAVLRTMEHIARAAMEPLEPPPRALEAGSLAARFLDALLSEPELTNTDLCERLRTDATQLSRTGRRLIDAGLVVRHKRGRMNRWVVTPRGRMSVAATALTPAGVLSHVTTVLAELSRARSASEVKAAAETLVRLGLSERRSANTRGSLVRSAPQRLSAADEQALIELYRRADETANDVLHVLSEWGSSVAARALSALVPVDGRIELLRALRRLGGPDASSAVSARLSAELRRRQPSGEVVAEAVNALTELASGGRLDMTDSSPLPAMDARWHPDDAVGAGKIIGDTHRALVDAASHPGVSSYLRQRSELTARQVLDWAAHNSIDVAAASLAAHPPTVEESPDRGLNDDVLDEFFADLDTFLADDAHATGALVAALHSRQPAESSQAPSRSRRYELPTNLRRELGFGAVLIAHLEHGQLRLTLDDVQPQRQSDRAVAYVEAPEGALRRVALVPAEGDTTVLTGSVPWSIGFPSRIGLRVRVGG